MRAAAAVLPAVAAGALFLFAAGCASPPPPPPVAPPAPTPTHVPTRAVPPKVGETGQAIGIDQNSAMIAQALKATPAFLDNVRFVLSDLAALDLPDETAHVLISNCTINHAPDKQAVYREIIRRYFTTFSSAG